MADTLGTASNENLSIQKRISKLQDKGMENTVRQATEGTMTTRKSTARFCQ